MCFVSGLFHHQNVKQPAYKLNITDAIAHQGETFFVVDKTIDIANDAVVFELRTAEGQSIIRSYSTFEEVELSR